MAPLLLFCVAMLLGGAAVSRFALRTQTADEWQPGTWERAATLLLTSLGLAIGVGWGLLLAHLLVRWALLAAAVGVILLSARSTRESTRELRRFEWMFAFQGQRLIPTAALILLGVWLTVNVASGSAIFFQNNDALGYHMPRAALLASSHAFHVFDMPDARGTWPIDFELLLAETIALAGTDSYAAFVPVFGCAVFLTQVGALVERWWGRGDHALCVTLMVAAMPIMILHTSTLKNDTFECAMTLAALRLAAMWTATRSPWLPLASTAAAVMSIGFKVSGGIVVLATAGILAGGLLLGRNEMRARAIASFAVVATAFVFLLGGYSYLYNLATIRRPFLNLVLDPPYAWGHYENVWRYLYVSVVAPFLTDPSHGRIPVPWSDQPWSVSADDPFFSNFGVVAPALLVALPYALFRYRRKALSGRFERAMTVIPCLAIYVAIVGFDMKPLGFFVGSARFLICLPAILAASTLAPALRELASWKPKAALPIIVAATALLIVEGYVYAYESPGGVVRLAIDVTANPAFRRAGAQPRAAYVVDRSARETDVVAMDAGYDSFSYPLYGSKLTREVRYLHSERPDPIVIADDVRWVAIDRGWHCMFGSPDFQDFGDWRYFAQGKPTPTDRRVFEQMVRDVRFKLVWENKRINQAVFRRIQNP